MPGGAEREIAGESPSGASNVRPRPSFGGPAPTEADEFGLAAGRLAGIVGVIFGWSPATFWSATPVEVQALVRALSGEAAAPPDGATIARLQEAFPDG